MGNLFNTIYEDLKSLDKEQLKATSILVSGAVSAAIILKAVKPLFRFLGVMFISLSLSFVSYQAVLSSFNLNESFWAFSIIWLTSFVSYPLAKGLFDLLNAVITIISDRVKNFFKTYTPNWVRLIFKSKGDGDTV